MPIFRPLVTSHKITFDSLDRSYILCTPQTIAPRSGYPVIIGFAGLTEAALEFAAQCNFTTGPNSAPNYVQIYPQGVFASWNCGVPYGYAGTHNIDDVGFVQAVLAEVAGTIAIDQTRVYATGISMGADFSAVLAAAIPQRIAAIAQVSCALQRAQSAPALPMPVMLVKGDADAVTPIGGGGNMFALPFADLETFWQTANSTTGSTNQTLFNNLVAQTTFTGGTAPTVAYIVTGMGHQWPIAGDGNDFLGMVYLGPVCPAPVNLNAIIIAFFGANHR